MKQLLYVLLLVTITATAYADKNAKPNKVKQSQPKPQQTAQPATDTAWHGTGKEEHYEFRQRDLDPRLGRSMPVDPSAQPHNNNPYQNTTNKPIKAEDIK